MTKRIINYIVSSLLCTVGSIGFMLSLIQNIELKDGIGIMILLTMLLSFLMTCPHYFRKKYNLTYINIAILAGVIIFCIIKHEYIINSMIDFVNEYAVIIQNRGTSWSFWINKPYDTPSNEMMFVYIVMILTVLLFSYITSKRKMRIIVVLLMAVVMLLPLNFDIMLPIFVIVMNVMFVLALISTLQVSFMAGIAFLVGFIVVNPITYKRPQMLTDIKQYVLNDATDKEINNNSNGDGVKSGLSNGNNIGQQDGVSYTGETVFRYYGPMSNNNVYLRSYAGDVFEDGSWKAASNIKTELRKTYYSLMSNPSDTSRGISMSYNILDTIQSNSTAYKTFMDAMKKENIDSPLMFADITIDYTEANSGYAILPYATSLESGLNNYNVMNIASNVKLNSYKKYTVATYIPNIKDYSVFKKISDDMIDERGLYSRLSYEHLYRQYVYGVYTEYDNMYLEEFEKAFGQILPVDNTDEEAVNAFIVKLQDYFKDNYEYTLTPGRVPSDKEAVSYFLNESKKGYCVYYATAAALILRKAGIPTRYAEGYVISPEDRRNDVTTVTRKYMQGIEEVSSTYEEYEIYVKDKSAHAWVEIYKDGYGWVPVEFTTAYVIQADSSDQNEQESSSTVTPSEESSENIQSTVEDEPTSQEVSQTEAHTEDNTDTTNETPINMTLLISIVIVLLLASIYAMCHISALKRTNALFDLKTNMNDKKRMFQLYQYFEQICLILGFERNRQEDYEKFASNLKENCQYIAEFEIDDIIDIILKARFGNEEISNEELKKVVNSINLFRKKVYQNSKLSRKIMLRYIKHMY